jgi:hypothetical protein
MKRILCSALLLLAFSLNAQAPVPLAHGDVPGEPHHHLKIENEYVRAYYVEVPPHEDTLLHQHDHDYLFVTLGDTEVINAVLGKPEVKLSLKDGEVRFTRGGFAHVARNLSDKPFRNVTIELLHAQGEAHNTCGFVIPGQGAAICDPPPGSDWADTQFETSEVTLDLVWLFANGKHTESASKFAFLVVGLGGPQVKVSAKGKSPKVLREREVEWFDPGTAVQFSHAGTEVAKFLKLTFRDSTLRSRP